MPTIEENSARFLHFVRDIVIKVTNLVTAALVICEMMGAPFMTTVLIMVKLKLVELLIELQGLDSDGTVQGVSGDNGGGGDDGGDDDGDGVGGAAGAADGPDNVPRGGASLRDNSVLSGDSGVNGLRDNGDGLTISHRLKGVTSLDLDNIDKLSLSRPTSSVPEVDKIKKLSSVFTFANMMNQSNRQVIDHLELSLKKLEL